jgi:hypothetical protein
LSIYGLVTHGCIRLSPENIETLFPQVGIGMRGKIAYEPVLITRFGDSVLLEVHPDAYGKGPDPMAFVKERARSEGYLDLIDFQLARVVIKRRDGVARDVTRKAR